jgi:hypothetical protein
MRIKISGYITVDDDQRDPDSPTGLTEEAYLVNIADETGTGLKVADLDEVEVRVVG